MFLCLSYFLITQLWGSSPRGHLVLFSFLTLPSVFPLAFPLSGFGTCTSLLDHCINFLTDQLVHLAQVRMFIF